MDSLFGAGSGCTKSVMKPSLPPPCDCQPLTKAAQRREAGSDAREQIADFATRLVHMTRQAVMYDNSSPSQQLIDIYKELGEQRLQIRQIESRFPRTKRTNYEQTRLVSQFRTAFYEEPLKFKSTSDSTETQDSCTVDVFYDCASRLSMDPSGCSVDALRTKFSGSPDYYFEMRPSFYPEQYMAKGLLTNPVFVFGVTQPEEDHLIRRFFILYAETPRQWHRMIISFTCFDAQTQSSILRSEEANDCEFHYYSLPATLQDLLLNTILPRLELFYSVTSLSMCLRKDEHNRIAVESQKVEATEDHVEHKQSDEAQTLQDIDDLGCDKFSEREVVFMSRISSTCFQVLVKSRICVEQKLPFAGAGERKYRDYFKDLKLLHSLRDCSGVVEFIGVVLSHTSLNLKSYLYELPLIESLQTFVGYLSCKSVAIQWSIKAFWARQIIQAVSEVHKRGVVVGRLSIHTIALRADGTAVLSRIGSPRRRLVNRKGDSPPELRNASTAGDNTSWKSLNFRTDIFQLGDVLWRLAEEKAKIGGCFCIKQGCTNFPRHTCRADHTNPVELPACGDGIPPYFNHIIRQCRLPDPKDRPPARKLAELLSDSGDSEHPPSGLTKLLTSYSSHVEGSLCIYCEECGVLISDVHFHCYTCYSGEFDVCESCHEQGVHCCNSEHQLVKRTIKNGAIVDDC